MTEWNLPVGDYYMIMMTLYFVSIISGFIIIGWVLCSRKDISDLPEQEGCEQWLNQELTSAEINKAREMMRWYEDMVKEQEEQFNLKELLSDLPTDPNIK